MNRFSIFKFTKFKLTIDDLHVIFVLEFSGLVYKVCHVKLCGKYCHWTDLNNLYFEIIYTSIFAYIPFFYIAQKWILLMVEWLIFCMFKFYSILNIAMHESCVINWLLIKKATDEYKKLMNMNNEWNMNWWFIVSLCLLLI